jgi:hypothetical protein
LLLLVAILKNKRAKGGDAQAKGGDAKATEGERTGVLISAGKPAVTS